MFIYNLLFYAMMLFIYVLSFQIGVVYVEEIIQLVKKSVEFIIELNMDTILL